MEDQVWNWSCSHHDPQKTKIDYVYFYAKGVFVREADPKAFVDSNIEQNLQAYNAKVSDTIKFWKN